MAIGRRGSESGGVFAPADVRGAGDMQWGSLIGITPDHPLVSEGGPMPYDIYASNRASKFVTTPAGQSGAAGGVIDPASPGARAGAAHLDNWKDVLNFKGSPLPWLLIAAAVVLFFGHASLNVEGGALGHTAAAKAAYR